MPLKPLIRQQEPGGAVAASDSCGCSPTLSLGTREDPAAYKKKSLSRNASTKI